MVRKLMRYLHVWSSNIASENTLIIAFGKKNQFSPFLVYCELTKSWSELDIKILKTSPVN